jgi:hypothetical protein
VVPLLLKTWSRTAGRRATTRVYFPITDSGRPVTKETHEGFLNERDLRRTATKPAAGTPQVVGAGTLGSIPPFGEQQVWQAPPYRPGAATSVGGGTPDLGKAEREAMEKSSLIYVRSASASSTSAQAREVNNSAPELGLGLSTGTRLRARLESAVSTAVRAPLLAVIEYNYEREGEIVVPAGAKAVGHIRSGDRSGYVDIQFDSLLMPDGTAVPIEAAATNLDSRWTSRSVLRLRTYCHLVQLVSQPALPPMPGPRSPALAPDAGTGVAARQLRARRLHPAAGTGSARIAE